MIKLKEQEFLKEMDYVYNVLIRQYIEKQDLQEKEGRKSCPEKEFLKGRLDSINHVRDIMKKHKL